VYGLFVRAGPVAALQGISAESIYARNPRRKDAAVYNCIMFTLILYQIDMVLLGGDAGRKIVI
jgi:hypothetical protein